MAEPIKLFYLKGGNNFGDILSKDIVATISGRDVIYSKAHKADMCAVGSILNKVLKTRVRRLLFRGFRKIDIWGTGINSPGDVYANWGIRIHALRGNTSQSRLGVDNNACVIGDPALLSSKCFPLDKNTDDYILVCPHQNDKESETWIARLREHYNNIRVCDLGQDTQIILKEINNAKAVFTSAMHPLIVAHSYQTPVIWIDAGHPTVIGGEYKFLDYYSAITLKPQSIKTDDIAKNGFSKEHINAQLNSSVMKIDELEKVQKELTASFPKTYLKK